LGDNIKIDVQEVGFGHGQGLLAGCCEFGDEPSGYVKFGEFLY
jgi:hypothetical protein